LLSLTGAFQAKMGDYKKFKEATGHASIPIGWVNLGTQNSDLECPMFALFHALKLAKTKFGDCFHQDPESIAKEKLKDDETGAEIFIIDNQKVPAVFLNTSKQEIFSINLSCIRITLITNGFRA
jgi:hypothetical protein